MTEHEHEHESIIKHIVISGGGPSGIVMMGVLQHLEKNGFWNISNIKTIYATSIGTAIAVLLALKFDWESIKDYIILRPWHDTYTISAENFIDSYIKKGLFGGEVFDTFFKPFFESKDLSLGMTMREFYEYTGIDLHFFTVELNSFECVDLNYKSFPDLPIIQAVHMSSAIPTIICPVCLDTDKLYVDGGVVNNYPIQPCLEQDGLSSEKDEILGIYNKYDIEELCCSNSVNNDSTILEYMVTFLVKLLKTVCVSEKCVGLIPNEIICLTKPLSLTYMKDTIQSSESRRLLFEYGIETATHFLEQKRIEFASQVFLSIGQSMVVSDSEAVVG